MTPRVRPMAGLLAGALLLAACSGATTSTEETTAAEATTAAEDTAAGDGDMASPDDAATSDDGDGGDEAGAADDSGDPATDEGTSPVLATQATAPDGSTFTIGDYAGQPVLVETFATWCSTCRRQLGATQEAAVEAGDDAVFLVLSVETSIDPATLATYAEEEGFGDLRFGVLDAQGLATFEEAFGRSVLNPPSTPKFRVGPDGELSELTTGMESAEEILATLSTS